MSDHPRLILVVYCLLCWLPGFFTIPATDRDESRFAQATRQMLQTGDFVDIRNGAEPRNRKPIGIHWLQAPFAASARAAGLARQNPIWPYRLPSLIGALIAVLTTRAIGARLYGGREGLWAAVMLGGSVLLTVEAHLAKTDAALLGATTLAMAVLARAYLTPERVGRGEAAGFWLALGIGVLIKGPITPMVAGLAAVTLVVADRRVGWLGALRPAWGVPLALAVVLPWFVAIEISTHGGFLAQAAGGDLAGKIAGGDDTHGAPPGYHLLALSAALFPAAFVVLRALPQAWAARRQKPVRFLLAWAGPAWLVFEAVPTKLPHYTLPLYPALCLLGAWWLLRPGRFAPRWLAIGSAWLFVMAAALFGVGAAALPWVVDTGRSALDWVGLPGLLAAGLIAALVVRAGGDMRRAVASGLLAAPVLYWAVLGFEVPLVSSLWVSERVARLAASAPGGLAAVGYAEPSLRFAAGTGTKFLGPISAASFLRQAPQRAVAVAAPQVPAFLQAAGVPAPHQFGSVDGFDYSNGHRIALKLFDVPSSQPESQR